MPQNNNSTQKSAKALLLSIGLTITLISCGGGGGGGSAYPSIQYAGVNTPATITNANASDFPVTMLEGSTSSSDANPLAIASNSSSTPSAQHAAMLNILAEQIKNDILNQQNNSDNNLVSAATQTSNGTCTPNAGSLTFTDNSTQTNLNGSFTYNNYCIDIAGTEIELHGKMSYSGTLFLSGNDPIFQSMTISIEYLKFTVRTSTETVSEEFSGSMTLTFDGSIANNVTGLTVTTNFEANGLTYKIENLAIDTSGGMLNISGTFYHPTHGYVDVTTTAAFTLVGTSPDKYCGGTLQLTGGSGDVIDFTANADCSQYNVTITPSGSGTPTYDSGMVDWP